MKRHSLLVSPRKISESECVRSSRQMTGTKPSLPPSLPYSLPLSLPPRFIPPAGSSSTFAIRHYHGTVIYDTYSLLNANADTLADDIVATFNSKVWGGRVGGRAGQGAGQGVCTV